MKKQSSIWRAKIGFIVLALAPLFAVSPYVFGAFLSLVFCGPDANEGNCAWAALPWFMFFTIPAAAVMFIAGLIILIVSIVKKHFN